MSTAPSPFTRHIAATLRAERARRRTSAQSLADAMDVSLAQTYKVLNGEKPITMDHLLEVCRVLGLDVAAVVADARAATLPLAEEEDPEGDDVEGFLTRPLARST